MRTMGIRELKAHLSDAIRDIQKTGNIIEVTHRGEPVAHIVPVHRRQATKEERLAAIESLDALAAEISALWPEGVTALDAVHDVRRDL
jgi:prevent-host-death family protein